MQHHPIVHVDITGQDPAASSKFYSEIFGWQTHYAQQFDYHMFTAEGGPGGGFTKEDGQMYKPGQVLIYIGTDDIDATLTQVEAHGGKTVVAKMEIPGTGWRAIFSDPSGTVIGLYTDLNQQKQA